MAGTEHTERITQPVLRRNPATVRYGGLVFSGAISQADLDAAAALAARSNEDLEDVLMRGYRIERAKIGAAFGSQ